MLSSSDVAQMFAAQNQQFMGQNQFAQQIGVSNPNLSLSAWGTDPRQKAFGQQGTFGGHAPVSYAQTGMAGSGYGGGTAFAGGAMSLMGGAASAGIGLMSNPFGAFVGGMGHGGSAIGQMMGAGRMSAGIGGLVGGGIAGGALAAGASMLPAYMAQKAIGAYVGGGQAQQGIQTALGGFGFQNSASRTGQGFTRDDAQSVGNNIRQLAHVPEMMTSVEELTKLIPKLKASGLMQGVRDASEFNSRFKEAVKTLRDVSKVLGSSMEEATQMFEHSRSVGFLGRKDQLKNAMNVQFTAAQTGMSTGEVQQLQSTGAGMSRQVGGRGIQGAAALTNIAQRIEVARQSGNISEEMIQDVTGQGGPAGVKAASERMYGLMLNMRNTSAGRLIMAGAMKRDEDGKVSLDEKVIEKLNRGQIGIEDLKKRASNLSHEDKISFTYRAGGSLGSQFAGSADAGKFMQSLVGDRGKDAAALVLQRFTGGSEQDTDMLMQLGGGAGGGDERKKAALALKKKMDADIADRTDPSKIMARIGIKLKSGLGLTAVEKEGASMYTHIGKAFDEFIDEAVGRYSVQLSEEGAKKMSESFRSGQGRKELADIFQKSLGAPKFSISGKAGGFSKLLTAASNPLGFAIDSEASSSRTQSIMTGAFNAVSGGFRDTIGDDPDRQREFLQRTYGAHAGSDESLNSRFDELRKMGSGDDAARRQMKGLVDQLDKNDEFTQANPEDRQRMIQEELGGGQKSGFLTNLMTGGRAGEYDAARTIYKRNKYSDIIAFAEKNKISEAESGVALTDGLIKNANTSGASLRDQMRASAKNIKAAEVALGSIFGDDASDMSAMMKTGGVAGDVVIAMTSADDKNGKAIRDVLDKKLDPEEGAKALSEITGKKISMEDYEKIKTSHQKIAAHVRSGSAEEQATKANTVSAALRGLWGANKSKDTELMFQELSKLGNKMKGEGGGKLKTAISKMIGAKSGDEFGAASDEAKAQLSAVAERLMGAKTQEEKEKILEEVGGAESDMGQYLQNVTAGGGRTKGLKRDKAGKSTKEQFAKSLGIQPSQIEESLSKQFEDSGGKLVITKEMARKATKDAAGGGLVGVALGAKDKADKDPQRLVKTLDSIDSTLKLLNTNVTINNMTPGERADYKRTEESKAAAAAAAAKK